MKNDIQNDKAHAFDSPIERARKAVSDHYAGVNIEIDGPVSIRDNSQIFHATVNTATPLQVAIKLCLDPQTKTPDKSAAVEQFAALERVSNVLENDNNRFRVPKPLCLSAELATFAMSWVEGKSLTSRLRHPSVFMKGEDWIHGIGAWLGNFHKVGPLRRCQVCLDERIKVIEELRISPMPDRAFAEAIRVLQKTAPTMNGMDVEVSWLHGDCKTDNFLLSGNGIYGIDISLSYENPVEYDLAQFMNNLDLLLRSPQYLYLRGMQSKLEAAFWRGYRSTGPSVSDAYLNWLRLGFSLSFWHSMLKGRHRNIRTWILNRLFAKQARNLCGKIGFGVN